jgi:hypothetical protein
MMSVPAARTSLASRSAFSVLSYAPGLMPEPMSVLGAPLRTAWITYLLCSWQLPHARIMSTPASSAALAVHSSKAVVTTS